MGDYRSYVIETFVTLAVVLGLSFGLLVAARRVGVGRGRGPMKLRGQLPLDARRTVYLVEVGEQVLVLGGSEAGLTRLGEVPASALPDDSPPERSFRDVLARVGVGRRSAPSEDP